MRQQDAYDQNPKSRQDDFYVIKEKRKADAEKMS
jgi:hypothetical protein